MINTPYYLIAQVDAIKKVLDHEILATPTGERRNTLTEANILAMELLDKLADVLRMDCDDTKPV